MGGAPARLIGAASVVFVAASACGESSEARAPDAMHATDAGTDVATGDAPSEAAADGGGSDTGSAPTTPLECGSLSCKSPAESCCFNTDFGELSCTPRGMEFCYGKEFACRSAADCPGGFCCDGRCLDTPCLGFELCASEVDCEPEGLHCLPTPEGVVSLCQCTGPADCPGQSCCRHNQTGYGAHTQCDGLPCEFDQYSATVCKSDADCVAPQPMPLGGWNAPRCLPDPALPSGLRTCQCASQSDCTSGLVCCTGYYGVPHCSATCDGRRLCTSDADCPAASPHCADDGDLPDPLQTCRCDSRLDCPQGETCCLDSAGLLCSFACLDPQGSGRAVCSTNSDCPAHAPVCLDDTVTKAGVKTCGCSSASDCGAGEDCCFVIRLTGAELSDMQTRCEIGCSSAVCESDADCPAEAPHCGATSFGSLKVCGPP